MKMIFYPAANKKKKIKLVLKMKVLHLASFESKSFWKTEMVY